MNDFFLMMSHLNDCATKMIMCHDFVTKIVMNRDSWLLENPFLNRFSLICCLLDFHPIMWIQCLMIERLRVKNHQTSDQHRYYVLLFFQKPSSCPEIWWYSLLADEKLINERR